MGSVGEPTLQRLAYCFGGDVVVQKSRSYSGDSYGRKSGSLQRLKKVSEAQR